MFLTTVSIKNNMPNLDSLHEFYVMKSEWRE